ncbi:YchF/TatD family DNA exonuclease [Clostridium chromiireducens]|uniref:YchF/TatD family DNA exonuclease n=1 Tax=Clostridium chromiireducens TaxID=225345 RepID=A0A964W570_9CLOT|nr:TatD family hydrolase [Clostridium chromiireducens]MVX67134.1 YchF/TatD family DNA exonuclease [Clostridium chromiireducens]
MEEKFTIIDSHAHYDDDAFNEDRELVLEEIKKNGVVGVLNCASSYNSLSATDKLTREYDFMFGALGIHPENAYELKESAMQEIRNYIDINDKIVAIGEIGLDYYWDENPPKDVQKDAFRKQMNLAKELGLPVVIHDRDAHSDTLEIMKEFPEVTGVIHCFSGSVEFAKECIKLGYYIGFTGVITFKNAKKIIEVAKEIPLERILVETDCPYMAPEPNRGKRNKSDYIEYIITRIAEIKEIDPYKANLSFNENFLRLIKKEI